jgi:hypothetical protein
MTANAKALAHAQLIITELIETILNGVEYPIEVSKLEGDAVFLYSVIDTDEWADPETHERLCMQLLAAYAAFADRVIELTESRICICDACSTIDRLRLKMVMHAGTALFHKVGQFNELAGVDVILVHRLLKNSIQADEYVLVTEPAFDELRFPETIPWTRGSEQYEELGEVSTHLYVPERERQRCLIRLQQRPLHEKIISSSKSFTLRLFRTQPIIWGLRKMPTFHHLPQRGRLTTRSVQTALLLVMTPPILVIGLLLITVREFYRHISHTS